MNGRHICGSCLYWASTDRVWGRCNLPDLQGDRALARAAYVKNGVECAARLETEWRFGCNAFSSLRKALRAKA